MKFLKLMLIQAKISSKNLGLVFSVFLLPLIMTIGVNFGMGFEHNNNEPIGDGIVINLSQNNDINDIFDQSNLSISYSNNFAEAINKLKAKEILVVYVIEEDFNANIDNGIVPIINSYQLEDNTNNIDQLIHDKVINLVKTNLLENYNIDANNVLNNKLINIKTIDYDGYSLDGNILAAIFVLYTLFLSSGTIASNLFNLKESKVLTRMLTTNNSGFSIIASFCLGNFLLQTILSLLAALILKQFFGFVLGNLLNFILSLVLLSIFSISFSLLIARTFKKVTIVSMVGSLGGLIFFFAGIINMIHEFIALDAIFVLVAKLSPFWWAMDIFMNNNIIQATIILMIMNIILISISSINLNKFIND